MTIEIKTKLINRSHVRKFALDVAQSRGRKFTRVGGEFFLKCEGHLKEIIRSYVHRMPGVGKTIL
jgi:hypothetical protein